MKNMACTYLEKVARRGGNVGAEGCRRPQAHFAGLLLHGGHHIQDLQGNKIFRELDHAIILEIGVFSFSGVEQICRK